MEDCQVTRQELEARGYRDEEITAIEALTKKPDEHGDYGKFIGRVSRNRLATRVKLADLNDNMDLSRLARVTDADRERLAKYERARQQLLGATSRRDSSTLGL